MKNKQIHKRTNKYKLKRILADNIWQTNDTPYIWYSDNRTFKQKKKDLTIFINGK